MFPNHRTGVTDIRITRIDLQKYRFGGLHLEERRSLKNLLHILQVIDLWEDGFKNQGFNFARQMLYH